MLDAVVFLCMAAVAIVLHEVAHGWAAFMLGDPTAKRQGRLTLNPIPHIDPVGSILVPGILFLAHVFHLTSSMVLFGWAKPVPVDFRQLRPQRLGMVLVAIAGPLVNILLAFVLAFLYKWPVLHHFSYVFGWGVMLNLMLAVFNMTPIPPLDGSRVVTALLPRAVAAYYIRLEPYGLFIVIVLLQLGMLQFLYPIISWLASLMGIYL